MGFFAKLFSRLIGGSVPAANTKPEGPAASEVTFTVTTSGPAEAVVEVSDSEVADRVKEHAFVLDTDLPLLKTADQWWEEEVHKRRVRDGSEKAYAWLLPFVPLEIAKLELLTNVLQRGPHGAAEIAKLLRALIRERRKANQPYTELLMALYGASMIADLSKSLAFEGTQPHYMARFVDINELQAVRCDYTLMGYRCSDALSKTDIKWLVEAFGEPSEHQSFNALFPHIRQNAVGRYCWSSLRASHSASESLGQPKKAMQDWLNTLAKRNLGYHKEWQERVAARKIHMEERAVALAAAWRAMSQPFVVADLETTGLNAKSDEVLEFAAVVVDPSGLITSEFSVLVRAKTPIPSAITKITGITQTDVNHEGRPLADAMTAFLAFIGSRPIFFHNAPFDLSFLRQAEAVTKLKFNNQLHDTLPIAWTAWPSLGTYKLSALARHVGAPLPTHRGLADAKATLAVLLAARAKAESGVAA